MDSEQSPTTPRAPPPQISCRAPGGGCSYFEEEQSSSQPTTPRAPPPQVSCRAPGGGCSYFEVDEHQ